MPPKKKTSKKDKGRGAAKKVKEEEEEEEEEYGPSRKESKKLERQRRAAMQKERQRRRHGDKQWDDDLTRFQRQLRPQRLYVRDVAGDGNCMFRALSDQLHDRADEHVQTREDVVRFIEAHRDDFEPFVEDDEPFDRYVARMRRGGTWGGHLELQAASLCYHANIFVHQLGLPRWDIVNFSEPGTRVLQLSYHDGQHWSSVRSLATATPREQAQCALLDAEQAAPDVPCGDGSSSNNSGGGARGAAEPEPPTREETIVMQQTGESDLDVVRRVLRECGGDVDDAVTVLVEQQAHSELGCDVDWREPQCAGYAQLASGSEDGGDGSAECASPLPVDVLEGTLLVPPSTKGAGTVPLACAAAPAAAAAEDGEVTDAERALMGVAQTSDIALVRTALANAHGDVDDAVDWIILHQSQASSSPAPEPEPSEQSPAPAAASEPKRTAPVGQKAAAAAAADLKKLEAAVAQGRALSKKQKRRLEKVRKICAAAPPPPAASDPPQVSSATQVASIRI